MKLDPAGRAHQTGYLHASYARSLFEFGRPHCLSASGGWILERDIPNSDYQDAMGCYPLFACRDWSKLCSDVEALGSRLISLTLVTDPFAAREVRQLEACFDGVVHFKDHHVVDLSRPVAERTTRHHRRYARQALQAGVAIEKCDEPLQYLDDWVRLYDVLIDRHGLSGIKRFSRAAFQEQLSVPGVVMFAALDGADLIAAQIWYLHGELAYGHLQATDKKGYETWAAYALYSEALDWLAGRCSHADLGAAAGLDTDDQGGLSLFKRGWATERKTAYLCRRVLDRDTYVKLSRSAPGGVGSYFPAYRAGELI